MARRILIGMLTPSSNTVLEPVTAAMLDELPEVSAHFARFRVTRIALDESGLAQFDMAPMLEAARLLADAKVDVICWNGTAASWLGFEVDRRLCARITAETGIAATSAVLGLQALCAAAGLTRLGLVTPYTDDVQARIAQVFAREGLEVVAERHLGISDNFAFSEVGAERLDAMAAEVAAARPQAIVPLCTNLRAAPRVRDWEGRFGVPVLDSVAVTLWHALVSCGARTDRIAGWGRLLAIAPGEAVSA
jgi:maleate isomerase